MLVLVFVSDAINFILDISTLTFDDTVIRKDAVWANFAPRGLYHRFLSPRFNQFHFQLLSSIYPTNLTSRWDRLLAPLQSLQFLPDGLTPASSRAPGQTLHPHK